MCIRDRLETISSNLGDRQAVRRCQARRGGPTPLSSDVANKGSIAEEVSRRRGSLGVEGRVADGEQEGERYRGRHLGSATQPALPARKAVVLEARRRPPFTRTLQNIRNFLVVDEDGNILQVS